MVRCLLIVVAVVSTAAVVIGFSGYLALCFFPPLKPLFIAIALIAVLSFVNFYSISQSVLD